MDIVDKMKSQIGDDPQHIFDHEALFKIGVAEIERLRDTLIKIADTPAHHAGQTANEYYFQQWAREALGRNNIKEPK